MVYLRARQYQFGGWDKSAHYLDSLEPLGLRCCVVCELRCGELRCGELRCGVVW